jgi:predicted dehydrogenase
VLVRNLLIGCGSVGKRHLSKLIELGQEIWVVDPNDDARKFARSQGDLILGAFPTLESFLEAEVTPLIDLAVIANWGPDHFYAFEKIMDLTPRTVLIEKPVTSKLSDLNSMRALLKDSKASVFVNFHLRFDSGFKQLLELCDASKYGTPALISIVAGAKCLSTNGIHWIDFSNQLIGSRWDKINASMSSQPINPRSKDLNFLEGFTNIVYQNQSCVSVNFTNSSYMDMQITIVWKNAKGLIVNGYLTVYEAESEIPKDQPVTRSALFTKKVFETPFSVDGFNNLYARLNESKGDVLENALEANELLILSLIASKTGSQLTANQQIQEDLVNFEWKIS